MAVQVLSPQNILQDSFNRQPLASRPMNRHTNLNRAARAQPEKKFRKSNRPNNKSPPPVQKAPAANKLFMGQVKILKRGEEIPKAAATPQVADLGSTVRLGPEPKLIQKLFPKQSMIAVPNPVPIQTKTAQPKPVQDQTKTAQPKPVQNQIKTAESDSQTKTPEIKPVLKLAKPAEPNPVQKRTKTANVKLVPKNKLADSIVAGFYAGSASSITSPEPSAVPLPSFFAKKAAESTTGEATSGLMKLLGLNLS